MMGTIAEDAGAPKRARPSGPVTLTGRFAHIERLDAARHGAEIWEAVKGKDDIWTHMAYGPFADFRAFSEWLAGRAALDDPLCYVVIDRWAGRALGVATLMEIRPAMGVVEVGHIVFSPALQRTPIATEAQYLLARHVFDDLGYRRYEWKCDALNAASRRAAERLGFVFEGVFRQHMIVKGRNRDTAWYAMLDKEWPRARAAFEQWLVPENFDSKGCQRRRLEDIRQSIKATADRRTPFRRT
jgi:RimJ/RimL family protein N-acetyltransferase